MSSRIDRFQNIIKEIPIVFHPKRLAESAKVTVCAVSELVNSNPKLTALTDTVKTFKAGFVPIVLFTAFIDCSIKGLDLLKTIVKLKKIEKKKYYPIFFNVNTNKSNVSQQISIKIDKVAKKCFLFFVSLIFMLGYIASSLNFLHKKNIIFLPSKAFKFLKYFSFSSMIITGSLNMVYVGLKINQITKRIKDLNKSDNIQQQQRKIQKEELIAGFFSIISGIMIVSIGIICIVKNFLPKNFNYKLIYITLLCISIIKLLSSISKSSIKSVIKYQNISIKIQEEKAKMQEVENK